MRKNNFRKVLMTAILTLLVASAVGCVVPYRPYNYDRYRRDDYYRRYDHGYRNDWRQDRYHWDRH